MSTDIIELSDGWHVLYFLDGKQVDMAGPFDEEWECEDVVGRA